MAWVLGVDLGTTFTAAASFRDGHAEIISLGRRAAAIPSVVLFRDDGSTMVGDAAELRAVTEPEHVAREFKRRVGDATPLLVGGAPRSPESIMGVLLKAVVAMAVEQEGSYPDRIAITHPASWGQFKLDVLRQAIRLAELGVEPELVPEPVAAAVHYARQQRVDLHDFVAVYDLGGGTFDAAVVRRTEDGFTLYGQPEGIERLGGIDVDSAVFAHVQNALGLQLDTLDRDDPAVVSAFARLRSDCTAAKEALSSDTDAVIPVMLPGLATEVRITRSELENMIRPAITDTLGALRRAITSGGLVPEHIARVLLVGGSSRIPLVGEMVTTAFGRPIALDTHPKHAVALGAAVSVAPKPEPAAAAPTFVAPPPAAVTPPVAAAGPAAFPATGPPPPAAAASTIPPFAPSGPPPAGPGPKKSNTPVIAAIAGVVALALVAIFFMTQSGGSKSASSSSSSSSGFTSSSSDPFSSGSSSESGFGLLTEEDAKTAASDFIETLFTFDSTDIGTLRDRVLPLTTGALHDELEAESESFASDVASTDTSAFAIVNDVTSDFFDTGFGIIRVSFDLEVTQFGSTDSVPISLVFVVDVEEVDGQFLASALANCSEGVGSSFSLGFSNSDATASC